MDLTHNLADVAQTIAGRVTSEFQAMLSREHRGARLDDITLVIRNLGYPMGKLAGTTTAPSVQNPFNFSQPPRPQHHYANTDYHHQTSAQYPGQQFSAATGGGGYNPAHYSQTQIHVPRPDHMQMPHLSHASMRPTAAYTQIQQPHQFQVQPDPYAPSSTSGMRRSGSDSRVNQPYTSSDISSIPTGAHPQSGQGGDMRYGGNFGGGLEPQHQYQTQVPATSVSQHIPVGGTHAGFSQQYSAAAPTPLDIQQNPGAYHTTTHNQLPLPTSPRHNYENWPEQEPRQRHHSSGSASEITGQLANVHVSSPPPPQLPPKPQGTAMPSAAPTNAESQYQQLSQQVHVQYVHTVHAICPSTYISLFCVSFPLSPSLSCLLFLLPSPAFSCLLSPTCTFSCLLSLSYPLLPSLSLSFPLLPSLSPTFLPSLFPSLSYMYMYLHSLSFPLLSSLSLSPSFSYLLSLSFPLLPSLSFPLLPSLSFFPSPTFSLSLLPSPTFSLFLSLSYLFSLSPSLSYLLSLSFPLLPSLSLFPSPTFSLSPSPTFSLLPSGLPPNVCITIMNVLKFAEIKFHGKLCPAYRFFPLRLHTHPSLLPHSTRLRTLFRAHLPCLPV